MRKLIYLLPLILLAGCAPQLQSGGWIIPVGLLFAGLYTFGRFFIGYNPFSKEVFIKGQKATFVYACIFTIAAIITFYIMSKDLL